MGLIKKLLLAVLLYHGWVAGYFMYSVINSYKQLDESKRECIPVLLTTWWHEGDYRICKSKWENE
jgi:hypothetical protein